MDSNITIGSVCKCRLGYLGVVSRVSKDYVYGVGFDGTYWESSDPNFIAMNIYEYITDIVNNSKDKVAEEMNLCINKLHGYE